jgi:hypothetical protein
MSFAKKKPVIGTIFSSSDSSEEYESKSDSKKVVSDFGPRRPARQVQLSVKPMDPIVVEDETIDIPGFVKIAKNRVFNIAANTLMCYDTGEKVTKQKYFKKYDAIGEAIVFGFYKHNKKNYAMKLSKIKQLYMKTNVLGGVDEDPLKDTIKLSQEQWKDIKRDMVISYKKKDDTWVYKSKFNAIIKSRSDSSSRMSMTSERGYNFSVDPSKIDSIYRHISSNDKTLSIVLSSIRSLENRIRELESKLKK